MQDGSTLSACEMSKLHLEHMLPGCFLTRPYNLFLGNHKNERNSHTCPQVCDTSKFSVFLSSRLTCMISLFLLTSTQPYFFPISLLSSLGTWWWYIQHFSLLLFLGNMHVTHRSLPIPELSHCSFDRITISLQYQAGMPLILCTKLMFQFCITVIECKGYWGEGWYDLEQHKVMFSVHCLSLPSPVTALGKGAHWVLWEKTQEKHRDGTRTRLWLRCWSSVSMSCSELFVPWGSKKAEDSQWAIQLVLTLQFSNIVSLS